jgi:hypothetical protein
VKRSPPWVTRFLSGLLVTGSVTEAVKEAGIDFETAWALRSAEPGFARYWTAPLAPTAASPPDNIEEMAKKLEQEMLG